MTFLSFKVHNLVTALYVLIACKTLGSILWFGVWMKFFMHKDIPHIFFVFQYLAENPILQCLSAVPSFVFPYTGMSFMSCSSIHYFVLYAQHWNLPDRGAPCVALPAFTTLQLAKMPNTLFSSQLTRKKNSIVSSTQVLGCDYAPMRGPKCLVQTPRLKIWTSRCLQGKEIRNAYQSSISVVCEVPCPHISVSARIRGSQWIWV